MQKVLASGADRLARLEGAKTATAQTPPSPATLSKTTAEAETASPAATAGGMVGSVDNSGTPELDSMAHAQAKRAAEARETSSSGRTAVTAPTASSVAVDESQEATRAFEEVMASAFAGMNDSYVTPHVPGSELLPGSASQALVAASAAVLQPAAPPRVWQLIVTVLCAAVAGLYGGNNDTVAVRLTVVLSAKGLRCVWVLMFTVVAALFPLLQRSAFTLFAAACFAAYAFPMLQATVNQVGGRTLSTMTQGERRA
jgi:hypothetical protein